MSTRVFEVFVSDLRICLHFFETLLYAYYIRTQRVASSLLFFPEHVTQVPITEN